MREIQPDSAGHALSDFAQRLRQLRKERKLTQAELGQRAGVHNVNLSRYERGSSEPSAETLKRLAEALEVSVGYLVEGSAEEIPSVRFEDPELRDQMHAIERLPEEDKQVVKRFLDAFLFRKRIQDLAVNS